MRNSEKTKTQEVFQKGKDRIHALAYEILLLANQGLLRTDFQQKISEKLLRFFGCDAVEIWLKDHNKYYPSETSRPTKGRRPIRFQVYPPRGVREVEKMGPLPPQPIVTVPYKAVSTLSLDVERNVLAYLHLKSRRAGFFPEGQMESYQDLAQILGIALAHRHGQVDLRERVKELTCLYEIARLTGRVDLSVEEILQRIADLLPSAWLYPQIASARIQIDERSHSTTGFREGRQLLSTPIWVRNENRGRIEVTYWEEKPELDEGPFLKEERDLLDAVAKEVSLLLERRQDATEKAKLEEQLRHADRLVTIGQLASGVAHELNEPLGAILGFAQLAKKCPGLPAQAEQDLDKVLHASLYAREVVKKLLIFARQMPPRKTLVDLNRVVEEGLFLFASRCAKEGIHLKRSLASDLPRVYADPAQLNQVLVNLVVNALQAMPQGGQLTISTSSRKQGVSLIVEDTGIGMEQEVQEKIFTPFFTTKGVGQGTGLGLPVVHGIVTSHGGSIHVESHLGRGTKFEIVLPLGEHGYRKEGSKLDTP